MTTSVLPQLATDLGNLHPGDFVIASNNIYNGGDPSALYRFKKYTKHTPTHILVETKGMEWMLRKNSGTAYGVGKTRTGLRPAVAGETLESVQAILSKVA